MFHRLFFSSFIFITGSKMSLQMSTTMQIKLSRQQERNPFPSSGQKVYSLLLWIFVMLQFLFGGALMHLPFSAACIFLSPMHIYKIKTNLLNWIKTEHQIDDCSLLGYVARGWDKTSTCYSDKLFGRCTAVSRCTDGSSTLPILWVFLIRFPHKKQGEPFFFKKKFL